RQQREADPQLAAAVGHPSCRPVQRVGVLQLRSCLPGRTQCRHHRTEGHGQGARHGRRGTRVKHMAGLELWGGVECTINRVGNTWYDQLDANGHRQRPEDLDLFASLGIRRLRQAVLWERHAGAHADWRDTDMAMQRLRQLDITPIVGLIHHGSGPPETSLVDEEFAPGLAAHAARVAARYPWVEWYTPVNEPLTTARFSGLYGLWHPHGRDDASFSRALITQCRATVHAMRAIRAADAGASLDDTADLGR